MTKWLKSLLWPLKQIDAALPRQGLIIDLGCGDGTVAAYLARESRRQVIGLDIHPPRRPSSINLIFKTQNILQANLKSAAGCLLSDCLHHLLPGEQQLLLERLSRQLKTGSACVIKEIDRHDFIRSKLSRFWDWLLYPQDAIHYYSSQELIRIMTKLKFTVVHSRPSPWFPGSVNLFVCTKL